MAFGEHDQDIEEAEAVVGGDGQAWVRRFFVRAPDGNVINIVNNRN